MNEACINGLLLYLINCLKNLDAREGHKKQQLFTLCFIYLFTSYSLYLPIIYFFFISYSYKLFYLPLDLSLSLRGNRERK